MDLFVRRDDSFRFGAVVSAKALTALLELESLQSQLEQRRPPRLDAEYFQPRLGGLLALVSGGILRPGSVSGLFMLRTMSVCCLMHMLE